VRDQLVRILHAKYATIAHSPAKPMTFHGGPDRGGISCTIM
jgi:hypothetical protein